MVDLPSNPFLQYYSPSAANPFDITLQQAIGYDLINITLPAERIENLTSEILPAYEWTAGFLVDALKKHLSHSLPRLLDLGSGTGAATRMLYRGFPQAEITAIEISKNMLELARYKFAQVSRSHFHNQTEQVLPQPIPERLEHYWNSVSSEVSRAQVEFKHSNIRNLDIILSVSYDGAIANHSLHWLGDDLHSFFKTVSTVLKPKAPLVWNTALDFVDSKHYPARDYSARYNRFIGLVSEKLIHKGYALSDYQEFRKPRWTLKDISAMAEENGFSFSLQGEILVRRDYNRLITFDLPLFIASPLTSFPLKDVETLARRTAAEVIAERPDFGADLEHLYDVNPIFIFQKK